MFRGIASLHPSLNRRLCQKPAFTLRSNQLPGDSARHVCDLRLCDLHCRFKSESRRLLPCTKAAYSWEKWMGVQAVAWKARAAQHWQRSEFPTQFRNAVSHVDRGRPFGCADCEDPAPSYEK